MNAFFVSMFGETAGPLVATVVAIALVILLLVVIWTLIRRARSGMFIMGGRSRKPRLAIIDAAPVDQRRRLVLVRRDNVEHLILIGGPNDLVIESGAQTQPSRQEQTVPTAADNARAAAAEAEAGRAIRRQPPAAPETPVAEPVAPKVADNPAPQMRQPAPPPAATAPAPAVKPDDDAWSRLGAVADRDPRPAAQPVPPAAPARQEPPALAAAAPPAAPRAPTSGIDDEMQALLDDLKLDGLPKT